VTDLSLLSILAAFFGLVMGWKIYIVIYMLLVRRNKNKAPFGAIEGLVSGFLLLAVAAAIADVSYLGALGAAYRVMNYFVAALIAGNAIHQLWLCARGMRSRG
jgi:hypothetical protein